MKTLVYNLSESALFKFSHFFGIETQLSISNIPVSDNPEYYCIEENITDIGGIIERCRKIYYSYETLPEDTDVKSFYSFYALMLKIKKQHDIGKACSDVEYIYYKLNDSFDVRLGSTGNIDGFTIDVPVLTGCSLLGKFMLYKPDENYPEFVFDVKPENGDWTHWHPQYYFDALDDVVTFMASNYPFRIKNEYI